MKRILAVVMCFILCISVTGCGSGSSGNGGASSDNRGVSGGKAVGTIGFENVENDPNNMLMGGKVAFSEDYIFFSNGDIDGKICRVGYDGAGLKVISSEGGCYLNFYNGYLYYMTLDGYEIKRVNLSTFEEEMVVDLFSEVASVKKQYTNTYGKTSNYTGEIYSIFIVRDYLFYTVKKGWSGTSEGTSIKTHAYNLITGEEKIIDDRAEYFTYDDENLYSITGNVSKLSFDDIKNKPEDELEFEGIYAIDFEDIESSMLSENGLYYRNSDTNNYEYYDYKKDEVKSLVEDSTREYDKKYLWNVIPVGDSVISYRGDINTWSIFKDAKLDVAPIEINSDITSRCRGVYKDKLYIVENKVDAKYITAIDADGNITKTVIG